MNAYRAILANRQRGFSLPEIMIGLLIGAFLMTGVLTVFDNTKRGNRYQVGLSQVQEEGRFAMEYLAANIRLAGYPANNPPAGNKIFGTNGATDSLTVQFESPVDCLDIATPGGVAVNRFRINQGNLECSGDGVNWDVYVPDVEDLQLLYGEDTDGDGIANRYVRADEGPAWNNVVTVRAALLARSMDAAIRAPETYADLTGTLVEPNDTRLRRAFISTINLRN